MSLPASYRGQRGSWSRGVLAATLAKEEEVPPHEVEAPLVENMESADGSASKYSSEYYGGPSKRPLQVD